MNLPTKLILSLGALLVVTVVAVQSVNYYYSVQKMDNLSTSLVDILRQREKQVAVNMFHSVERGLSDSLTRGEMEKFSKLLQSQREIDGLVEFSLYDRKGTVAFSSVSEAVGRPLPDDAKPMLSSGRDMVLHETPKGIEIYQPHIVQGDCVRCHTTWTVDEVCGLSFFLFSRQALDQAEGQTSAALGDISWGTLIFSIIAVAAIVLTFVLGMYVMVQRFVSKPLHFLVDMLKRYDVDLTLKMPVLSRDEIGAVAGLLNRFVNKLNRVIGNAQLVATGVGDEASRQAAAVEQTSATMMEMAAMTRQNAENSQGAKALMGEVSHGVGQADETIGSLIVSTKELSDASAEVAKIIKTIDEIAFQTNMLALNAAVEAARAGDAGKGFAVVADEVGNLAHRSAESARNTGQLIQRIIDKIGAASGIVENSGRIFDQLKGQISKAASLVDEIAEASVEQAKGIDEVNLSLNEIDRVTQRNAAQASTLADTMGTFETAQSQGEQNGGRRQLPMPSTAARSRQLPVSEDGDIPG